MLHVYLKSLLLVAGLAALLFVPSGDPAWVAGWAFIGLYGLFVLVAIRVVDPDLLKERARPTPGFDPRDAVLATTGFACLYIAVVVVAGFEHSGGGAGLPRWLVGLGFAAFVVGYAIALWAMVVNRYFSTFVRVQRERGHQLITQGPYGLVRHPGYAGMLLAHLGIPLALSSPMAFVPVIVGTVLFTVRLLREEQTLKLSLPGYREYQRDVPWRLAPWIW